MKNSIIIIFAISLFCSSCAIVNSTTFIKAHDTFLLGNNKHEAFKVKFKNSSWHSVEVCKAAINGGEKYSLETVKPFQTIMLDVERNTALIVDNKSKMLATVKLVITGNSGNLSMGYKN
jgi:hypothetical protein